MQLMHLSTHHWSECAKTTTSAGEQLYLDITAPEGKIELLLVLGATPELVLAPHRQKVFNDAEVNFAFVSGRPWMNDGVLMNKCEFDCRHAHQKNCILSINHKVHGAR